MISSHQPDDDVKKLFGTNVRYWVLAILCAAAAIAYLQRYAINFLAPTMQEQLALNEGAFGSIMAAFFTCYGLMQVPAGWLGDRYGSRRALTLYALAWSLLTGAMGLCGNWLSLVIVWSLMGIAQAGLFPCAVMAVRDWLPVTRRAFASGWLASCMNVGGALAPPLSGLLLIDAGWPWEAIFMALALPGVVWAIFFFVWFRDRPVQHSRVSPEELRVIHGAVRETAPPPPTGLPMPWSILITRPAMWFICLQQFFRAAAQVFFGTWFATFLIKGLNLSPRETSFVAGLPLVALIAGSMVGGVLSDWLLVRTGSRRVARQGFSVANLLACACLFGAACLVNNPYVVVALITLACVAMALGGVSSYAITMDMGGAHVATVFGLMNMSGSIGAALFPLYVGWLVASTENWNYVLLSIALIYLAAAVCWMLLNPNGSLFDRAASTATPAIRGLTRT